MKHLPIPLPLVRVATVTLLALMGAGGALAEDISLCGSLENAYGPFDYRTQRSKLVIVERFHFSQQVELLQRGQTSATLGGDLDYVLRASPNHHRALAALVRLSKREGFQPQPASLPRTIDCYFDRALRFQPEDVVARMLLAKHLIDSQRPAQALQQLKATEAMASNSGLTHVNIGLLYLELNAHDEALAQAHKALALGYTAIDKLREPLRTAGRWRDPAPMPASAPEAAASAAQPAAAAASAEAR